VRFEERGGVLREVAGGIAPEALKITAKRYPDSAGRAAIDDKDDLLIWWGAN
jgi:hypothetical protein